MELKTAVALAAEHGGRVTLNLTWPDGHFAGFMERPVKLTDKIDSKGEEGFLMVDQGRDNFVPWSLVTSWQLVLIAEGRVERDHIEVMM